ncbi:PLP-dependent transferase [Metschnikowia bicuspidata var. bicuspidata NRRL YB-4993]|uniref:Aspartate aminotransferase n=1 Tax=Metschnikowia bicuspidata var. bicuspidata NRRL YB-4993 TaxID=869754 RepID=A0A1A0H6H5_9ASCO|nr:PLP-dependent transferase [Metschnikowia bicuspidata var. bicuspidata NRRL YB-4993]OBA19513.1 PLP-dependent transferase [Metschnikowia bicuspidata var. bicuspidata NRRL YB-4993]
MSSFFTQIAELPPDPLFGLKARFSADPRADKVDLGIGAYRDDAGKPWVLPAVRRAERKLIDSPAYNHEYLGISGHEPFLAEAAKVILGRLSRAIADGAVVSQQTLSGTGALHLAGAFLKQFYAGNRTVYLSQPTWANHHQIFSAVGLAVATYPYWDADAKALDMAGFMRTIETAPEGSVFVLHACAHNPTGLDPTPQQWAALLQALATHRHLPVFDSAYQGFASGNLDQDAAPIRQAIDLGVVAAPVLVCQSFAKNVGMYGERVGALHVVLPAGEPRAASDALKRAIKSQLNRYTRSEISNPPAYGAKVVATILADDALRAQWEQDLVTMSLRISKMRAALKARLLALGTPGNWDHITNQTGMFSFTGLTPDMVDRLEKVHGVYLVSSGRASVAGLNEGNVDRVAEAFHEVIQFHSKFKL